MTKQTDNPLEKTATKYLSQACLGFDEWMTLVNAPLGDVNDALSVVEVRSEGSTERLDRLYAAIVRVKHHKRHRLDSTN